MTLDEHLRILTALVDEEIAEHRTDLLARVAEAEAQGDWRGLEFYRPRLAKLEETIKRRAAA